MGPGRPFDPGLTPGITTAVGEDHVSTMGHAPSPPSSWAASPSPWHPSNRIADASGREVQLPTRSDVVGTAGIG
jgi:hypothetical protein